MSRTVVIIDGSVIVGIFIDLMSATIQSSRKVKAVFSCEGRKVGRGKREKRSRRRKKKKGEK